LHRKRRFASAKTCAFECASDALVMQGECATNARGRSSDARVLPPKTPFWTCDARFVALGRLLNLTKAQSRLCINDIAFNGTVGRRLCAALKLIERIAT